MNTAWPSTELVMLTLAVYREARGEIPTAQIGVAWCIRNRVESPKWWGKDYLNCLFKKWQISSLTDPKDPQLTVWPKPPDDAWERAYNIAYMVKEGMVAHPFPGADSYHDISIPPPFWAKPEQRKGQAGRIIFYDTDGAAQPTEG